MATTSNSSGFKAFTATAVAIAEAVRVKLDSSGLISAAGVGEDWIGHTTAPVAASGLGTVQLLHPTVEVTAAGAFAVGARLYAAASGKVDDTANGDYTGLLAIQAASADGDIVEAVFSGHPSPESPSEVVTTTNVIAASESGSTFYLDLAGGFVSTLPAPALGLRYTFIVKTAPTTAYTIVTTGSANIIKGNQNSVAGDAGDSGTADDTITFVAGQSVAGDKVEVYSDGTSWFAYAISRVAAGITFTTAS